MNIHPKVAMTGIGGSFSVLVIWILNTYGIQIPDEVASAITTIFAFLAGYMTSSPEVASTQIQKPIPPIKLPYKVD